jgi:RNA polymerase-interacting CarD/CdnL/TRCF family regulator
MARGWESKGVEGQQSETRTRHSARDHPSAEEIERTRKRESLELSRRRIVTELQTSRSAVHRTALENALRFLEEELTKVH